MHADGNHPGMEKGLQFSGRVFDHAVSVWLDNLRERGTPSQSPPPPNRLRGDSPGIYREAVLQASMNTLRCGRRRTPWDNQVMLIRVGFAVGFLFEKPTPIVALGHIHSSRAACIRQPERLVSDPSAPMSEYRDGYGNRCTRLVAPAGRLVLRNDAIVEDSGLPEVNVWNARQHAVEELPDDVLLFLLASRYCEVDSELKEFAWGQFGSLPAGWPLVQAICDFVHAHIRFDYQQARANRTAFDAFRERTGVCRDYAHLAITLCRCLNVPARYCTGYLGDIGVPANDSPMDFSAWFEVYLGGTWHAFDARNNQPRIGRILMARGRDAADVALTTTFGRNQLDKFEVWTYVIS
jgi:transglutaminase-like putative cysteine protease